MNQKLQKKIDNIQKCINQSLDIMEKLENDDHKNVLNAIKNIKKLPDLTGDTDIIEFKEYQVMRSTLKKLYIATARKLIDILNEDGHLNNDEVNSFNYVEREEAMIAAEYIKVLPKAYIGGPMKAALSHPYEKVQKIAIDYFESLPGDLKYSEIFPKDFRLSVRSLKNQLGL